MINQELIKYLSGFLSEERFSIFQKVLSGRTKYITVVLDDIYQSQNASAVLRSCDCFGIQDVHIIENRNHFKINIDVTRGSTKWIDLHLYNNHENNAMTAINTLKSKGYRIVATTPHEGDVGLENFDLTLGKTAFVLGNEKLGISEVIKQNADSFLKIPMYGFTESLNISVSAAIILNRLSSKLRQSDIDWQLSNYEKELLMLEWLKKSLKSGELLIKKYMDSIKM